MKRWILAVALLVGLSVSLFTAKIVYAATYSNGTLVCAPSDANIFPYGFLCGSDNNVRKQIVEIDAAISEGVPAGGKDYGSATEISPRSTMTFEMGFHANGPPRNTAGGPQVPILAWAWIQGASNSVFSTGTNSTANISASGGAVTYCPGTNSGTGGRGILYLANNSGADNSPAMWNGSGDYRDGNHNSAPKGAGLATDGNTGFTNCGPDGLAAYWANYNASNVPKSSAGLRHFSFTIKLNPASTQPFCVREEVAVNYPGTTGTFGGSNPNAAHLAKQSDISCYKMASSNSTPIGDVQPVACGASTYTLRARDPNNVGTPVSFKLVHNSTSAADDSGTVGYSYTTRTKTLLGGRTYYLKVRDIQTGLYYTVDSFTVPPGCGGATTACNQSTVTDHNRYDPPGGLSVAYPTRTTFFVKNSRGAVINISVDGRAPEVATRFGGGETHTIRYTPNTKDINVTLTREYQGPSGSWTYYENTTTTRNCFRATCTVNSVTGGQGTGGEFLVGQTFTVTATINNPTNPATPDLLDLPGYINDNGVIKALTLFDGASAHDIGDTVELGGSETISWTQTANGSISNQAVGAFPAYNAPAPYGEGIGPTCAVTIPIFQRFDMQANAEIINTSEENPTTVSYKTGGLNNGPAGPVSASAQSWLTKQPFGGGATTVHYPPAPTDSYGGWIYHQYAYSNPSIAAGDKFCANVTLNPGGGYLGPGGAVSSPNPVSAVPDCFTTHNEPYAHVLGADVSAGGGFDGGSCSSNGGIKTYTRNTGSTPMGSGGMIAALAQGQIEGFSSANLRNASAPFGSIGLSFANVGAGASGAGGSKAKLGGNLNGSNCVTNYYSKMPPGLPTNNGNGTNVSGPAGAEYFDPGGTGTGTLRINGGTISASKEVAIYVKGNVYISNAGGGIRYGSSTGCPAGNVCWASLDDIPSFVLVAMGGNIYIDPAVTQLDGTYVAQPNAAGIGGTIYSCSTGSPPAINYSAVLVNGCSNQLVVNGSFVAKKVVLSRSFGSLRNSQAGERYNRSLSRDCTDSGSSSLGDCAAEIFNFSPETYLSRQATVQKNGPTTGIYEYITSLSPVL